MQLAVSSQTGSSASVIRHRNTFHKQKHKLVFVDSAFLTTNHHTGELVICNLCLVSKICGGNHVFENVSEELKKDMYV